jgi:hypothetical protein
LPSARVKITSTSLKKSLNCKSNEMNWQAKSDRKLLQTNLQIL